MSAKQNVVLILTRGVIAGLPPEDQAAIAKAAEAIRTVVKESGDAGVVALTLVSAEFSDEA